MDKDTVKAGAYLEGLWGPGPPGSQKGAQEERKRKGKETEREKERKKKEEKKGKRQKKNERKRGARKKK